MNKKIFVVGPTASGKTDLAIELAKLYSGEIICADSLTVYKYADIGTAKPSIEQQNIALHHLLSIIDPDQPFTVVDFKSLASKSIEKICKKDRLPIVVGGSGLYIDSLLFDYEFRNGEPSQEYLELTLEDAQKAVALAYPDLLLNNSDVNNLRRLKMILQNGEPKSSDRENIIPDALVLGIGNNLLNVKKNIEIRTKQMLNNNFIQEVENIHMSYPDSKVLKSVGYKEVLESIKKKTSLKDLEKEINKQTFRLAKKQLTWFRRNPNVKWVYSFEEAKQLAEAFL